MHRNELMFLKTHGNELARKRERKNTLLQLPQALSIFSSSLYSLIYFLWLTGNGGFYRMRTFAEGETWAIS
jgi:hypothetical protein